jgi:uncharacterized protein YndB with AHSA1/START domain
LSFAFDPDRDLVLERVVPITPEEIWEGWTNPSLFEKWFVPGPWSVGDVDVEFVPGGRSSMTMYSPDGAAYPNHGCILEAIPNRRLVMTDTMTEGFRPAAEPFFTAVIEIEPHPEGALYRATAIHGNVENRAKHEAMGFHTGWGQTLTQLVDLMLSRRATP